MDDHGNNRETATVLPISGFENDAVRRQGRIFPKADEDWFRFRLEQGEWYWFDLTEQHFVGTPRFEFYRENEFIGEVNKITDFYFRAKQSGTYYAKIFHGNSPGGRYVFSASRFGGPNVLARAVVAQPGRKLLWNNGGVFGNDKAPPLQFFYQSGDAAFTIVGNGRTYEQNTIHQVRKVEAVKLYQELGSVSQLTKPVHLYGRLQQGEFAEWTRTSIQPLPSYGNALNDRWLRGGAITYSFDNILPDYYDSDEYQDFRPLVEDQQRAVRKALNAWGEFMNVDFREVGSGSGTIRVANRFLDEPFQAFQRTRPWFQISNDTPEADVFLSNKLPHMQNLREGTLGFYHLLQSIGMALGFNHPNQVDQTLPAAFGNSMYTVMSSQNHAKFGDVYPSKPGLFDILQLQSNYRPSHPTEGRTYTFSSSGEWRGAIMASSGVDVVSAAGHNRPATIRLEANEFSFIGKSHQHFWVNAVDSRDDPKFHTYLETAKGSDRADRLVGSKERNHLFGAKGNDLLIGRQGNDFLNAGKGNDRYHWILGDGSDTIHETVGNGRDLLQIQSQWGLDDFRNDLSFSRKGSDLIVNLDFDNGASRQASITIREMGRGRSRIESLRLLGKDNQVIVNRVSLVSIWTQLSKNRNDVQFSLGHGSDSFGEIAKAVS